MSATSWRLYTLRWRVLMGGGDYLVSVDVDACSFAFRLCCKKINITVSPALEPIKIFVCGVCLQDRCRDSDVRERCGLKDAVTRVGKGVLRRSGELDESGPTKLV
ncbi:hypothetical protein EVAR_18103_1 [Eumeta japonica]|uniref:Uncharacterized protein n=1 Tax=Eumeta variegata TaxID=151549 RepID=A0A4C1VK17_EUMVA|nr:hypothetical protein EVAR_18103_1 [Eumeta japonica]